MKIKEFPESIADTQQVIDKLINRIEREPDKQIRRELWLFKMELRDHIIELGLEKQKEEV